MIPVVIESPYGRRVDGTPCDAEEIKENLRYLRECMADSFARGEAPFASHGIYPGCLDDTKPEERRKGMEAGFVWGANAMHVVVYVDHGITPGMAEGISRARVLGKPVYFRSLVPLEAGFCDDSQFGGTHTLIEVPVRRLHKETAKPEDAPMPAAYPEVVP